MFPNPNHHADDPQSSVAAGQAITASGMREQHAYVVYALVDASPGLTAIELMEVQTSESPLDEYQIRRRLTDLMASGCVRQGDQRECTVRGSMMVTWYKHGPFQIGRSDNKPPTKPAVLRAVLAGIFEVGRYLHNGGENGTAALAYIHRSAKEGLVPDLEHIQHLLGGTDGEGQEEETDDD